MARTCTRANAAKVFAVAAAPCTQPRAPRWFLTRLNISPARDRRLAEFALYYFNAKAQAEWAESLLRRFVAEPRKAQAVGSVRM